MCENCASILGLGCLCCCEFRCNVQRMRTALAFLPPSPPSYDVVRDSQSGRGRLIYTEKRLQESPQHQRASASSEVHWTEPRRGCQVPMVWLQRGRVARPRQKAAPEAQLVMLHCHGNATDLGHMMGDYMELSDILGVEVVGVEYTGYGPSVGKLHTKHVTSDIEAAYDLVIGMGVQPRSIIVYGQSVGSAPAVHLAATRRVGGLILHSPLASALRVIDRQASGCCKPSRVICCFDTFRNDKQIHLVDCPVLIMHGRRDDVVPFHNAQQLFRRCKEASRWPAYYVQHAGHNDLVEADPQTYFQHVSGFLSDVLRGQSESAPPAEAEPAPAQAEMTSPPQSVASPRPGAAGGQAEADPAAMPAPPGLAGPGTEAEVQSAGSSQGLHRSL